MKKYTIIANSMLFKAYIVELSILFAMLIWFWFVDFTAGAMMTVPILLGFLAAACITERWCLLVTFSSEGVEYKPLFRKGTRFGYDHYPRVQYAYYMHGNVFAAYKVHFFVMTNKRLDNTELSHINLVDPNTDLIRIRYTPKTYQRLLEALPPTLAFEVERIYEVNIRK